MPDVRSVVNQGIAGIHILVVGETGADAGTLFNIDMMSCGNIGADVVRGQANPVFVVLDLFYASDLQVLFILSGD